MTIPIPAPVVDHDALTTIEYWAFRLALLIVFLCWLVQHVIHELKGLRASINEWLESFAGNGSNLRRRRPNDGRPDARSGREQRRGESG